MPIQTRVTPALVCLLLLSSAAGASIVDQVAAVVDGRVITLSEVQDLGTARSRLGAQRASASGKEVLDLAIENVLIEKEASRIGASVSDEELNSAIAEVRKRNSLDDDGFRKALESQGISYDAYRGEVRGQILRAKVAGPVLRSRLEAGQEAKLREFYLKHVADFCEPEKLRLAHVELTKDKQAAETARSKIAAGLDPREAAKAVPGSKGYEDMGLLDPENLSEAIRAALKDVPAGGVSPVVELNGTCHLFVVTAKDERKVPAFEEVANRVRERYFEEKEEELYQAWLEGLKEKARIDRRL